MIFVVIDGQNKLNGIVLFKLIWITVGFGLKCSIPAGIVWFGSQTQYYFKKMFFFFYYN